MIDTEIINVTAVPMPKYNFDHGHDEDETAYCVYCNYPEGNLVFMFHCNHCNPDLDSIFGWGLRLDIGVLCLRCNILQKEVLDDYSS